MEWTLTAVSYDSEDARRLTQALHHEQLTTYGFADDPTRTPAEEFVSPHGLFVVAATIGSPRLGCGGWRTAGERTAELKHMYVTPVARNQGLGRRILQALEKDAICQGNVKMILETGVRNRAALSLYLACGFTPIKPYIAGRNPDINRAMTKTLGKWVR